MNYLYTKQEHYTKFVEEYKTDRLYKNLKIYSPMKTGKLIKEIFNEPIFTEYEIIEKKPDKILISFKTKSGSKYRLDIFIVEEKDKYIEPINHFAFSDFEKSPENGDDYEKVLKRHESLEIFNKIHFILIDLCEKKIINNIFCIGGAKLFSKNNIYEYALKIIVGDDGFKKVKTDIYKTGFGLYFKINCEIK